MVRAQVREWHEDLGDVVDLEWEAPGQDGFEYRATVVRKR